MVGYASLTQPTKTAWIVGFAVLMIGLERLFPAARPLAAAHLASFTDRVR